MPSDKEPAGSSQITDQSKETFLYYEGVAMGYTTDEMLDDFRKDVASRDATIAAQAEAIRVLREACEAAMEFHNDCYSHLDQRRLPSRTKQRTALIRKALASTAKYEEPRE